MKWFQRSSKRAKGFLITSSILPIGSCLCQRNLQGFNCSTLQNYFESKSPCRNVAHTKTVLGLVCTECGDIQQEDDQNLFNIQNYPHCKIMSRTVQLSTNLSDTKLLQCCTKDMTQWHTVSVRDGFIYYSSYFWWNFPQRGAGGYGQSTGDSLIFEKHA